MYSAAPDPYCYPGTTVLINRLDLRDQEALDAFEADAVLQRGDEPLPLGNFTITHYRAVHHHLFQDVCDWAGKYRTVRISKGESMFCFPEHIPSQMRRLFSGLRNRNRLAGRDPEGLATLGAHFLSELNAIHPFREGNGRAQMAFFAMLADHAGHSLDLALLEPEPFLSAMIVAFAGNPMPLRKQILSMAGG